MFVVHEGAGGRTVAGLRWITVGRERNDRIEVLTGLDDGERVVVEPDRTLSDGRPVEVRG